MSSPKAFQQATVEAACEVLQQKGGRPRFLVADEVGLGKTIVAQQVIARMARHKKRPLVVYYVSSSLTIAAQNGPKLVDAVRAPEGRHEALCSADRLSMLPFVKGPAHSRVHLYTLTPDTSLPNRQGRRRDGRKDERAMIAVLLRKCWRDLDDSILDIFKCNAKSSWQGACANAEALLKSRHRIGRNDQERYRNLFKEKVREHLNLSDGQHVTPVLQKHAANKKDAMALIGALRTAMVECTFELDDFQPDLVIFDEFQRFRDLVSPAMGLNGKSCDTPDTVLSQLRGDGRRSVPLLLLSATPYSLYNQREEEHLFGSHHDQLLELLCFLYGDGKAGLSQALEARSLFKEFGNLLRGSGDNLDFAAIGAASRKIEQHLTRVMSRTERALALRQSQSNGSRKSPEPIEVTTESADWKIFRHLSERFPKLYRSSAITYWRSVPLPMQTMGSGYIAWDKANKTRQLSSIRPMTFLADHVDRNRKFLWPHGKLRKLIDQLETDMLCLPWLPPSLPWWPLGKRWQSDKARQGKVLLFSRFRATPKAVAAALSHEARVKAAQTGALPKPGASLRLNVKRMAVFALFYPNHWLATCSDPLLAAGKAPDDVRKAIKLQLEQKLMAHGIKVLRGSRPSPKFWKLLAALDGQIAPARPRWSQIDLELDDVIKSWEHAAQEQVSSISSRDLMLLVDYALGAPGVVLTRSLMRHQTTTLTPEDHEQLIEFSLNGWRHYFDNPVFVATLRKRKHPYPDALRQAVFEGNLEASLDEHIWFMTPDGDGRLDRMLAELSTTLGVRGGRVAFHNPDDASVTVRCQCDVAMPLAQELESTTADGEGKPPRTDQIRKAFNSPFWPYVLTTTSVGQEGLDFHPWCQTLIHWDLPGNPVDLEQREGRIQRYAGLAVRRQMAVDQGPEVLASIASGTSPWRALAKVVNEKFSSGGTGLEPWWHYPGAEVRSYFFHLPASEEVWQLEALKQQRSVYRLALGQQHQEDFVRMVSARDPETLQKLADLVPDLSAWKKRKRDRARE